MMGVSFLWGSMLSPHGGGISHDGGGVSDGGGVWKGAPGRCHTEEEADREGTAPVNGKPRRGGVFRHFLMIRVYNVRTVNSTYAPPCCLPVALRLSTALL